MWNSLTPYEELNDTILDSFSTILSLNLYMDDQFGGAVPSFAPYESSGIHYKPMTSVMARMDCLPC
ncbi:MAG: hypothetical protein R2784_14255 [Saprospiraceae bacterium]